MLALQRKITVAVVGIACLATLGATRVRACLCPTTSIKKRVEIMKKEADAIFLGKVQSIEKTSPTSFKVVLSVEQSWKEKDSVQETSVYTDNVSAGGCGVDFVQDHSYLVYAKEDNNGLLRTEICWGTREASIARKDLKVLGKPLAKKPTKGHGGIIEVLLPEIEWRYKYSLPSSLGCQHLGYGRG